MSKLQPTRDHFPPLPGELDDELPPELDHGIPVGV